MDLFSDLHNPCLLWRVRDSVFDKPCHGGGARLKGRL
jgi:hypothetical protein